MKPVKGGKKRAMQNSAHVVSRCDNCGEECATLVKSLRITGLRMQAAWRDRIEDYACYTMNEESVYVKAREGATRITSAFVAETGVCVRRLAP